MLFWHQKQTFNIKLIFINLNNLRYVYTAATFAV